MQQPLINIGATYQITWGLYRACEIHSKPALTVYTIPGFLSTLLISQIPRELGNDNPVSLGDVSSKNSFVHMKQNT
jgi:hypothetical protein